MNSSAFEKYCLEVVAALYPDVQDVPGKRVLLKIDSGPGRLQAGL